MTLPPHQTGTVRSGDVDIFYRLFGEKGGAPALILHGANYYDSADWIAVAGALAQTGRAAAAFDGRGFGKSGWSKSKDYSLDAQIADMVALVDRLGWEKTAIVGASRGGGYATLFAALYPARTAALVLVDYYPDIGVRHPGRAHVTGQSIGNQPPVFASIEAWLATSSREKDAASLEAQRPRLESFLRAVPGGVILAARDPDWLNPVPTVPSAWATKLPVDLDMWAQLAKVTAPVLCVTATRSAVGHTAEQYQRLLRDYPAIAHLALESGHDVACGAPAALVAGIANFLARL